MPLTTDDVDKAEEQERHRQFVRMADRANCLFYVLAVLIVILIISIGILLWKSGLI